MTTETIIFKNLPITVEFDYDSDDDVITVQGVFHDGIDITGLMEPHETAIETALYAAREDSRQAAAEDAFWLDYERRAA